MEMSDSVVAMCSTYHPIEASLFVVSTVTEILSKIGQILRSQQDETESSPFVSKTRLKVAPSCPVEPTFPTPLFCPFRGAEQDLILLKDVVVKRSYV